MSLASESVVEVAPRVPHRLAEVLASFVRRWRTALSVIGAAATSSICPSTNTV